MIRLSKPAAKRLRKIMTEMIELHLRAHHLSHVHDYHTVQRHESRPHNGSRSKVHGLRKCWTLPVYIPHLLNTGQIITERAEHCGWSQFLHLKHKLFGNAEITKEGVLTSLSIGPSSKLQHKIIAKVIKSGVHRKRLCLLAVPALHFRGLSYPCGINNHTKIVTLSSPIVPLRRGAGYRGATVLGRLRGGLVARISAGRKIRHTRGEERMVGRSGLRSNK